MRQSVAFISFTRRERTGFTATPEPQFRGWPFTPKPAIFWRRNEALIVMTLPFDAREPRTGGVSAPARQPMATTATHQQPKRRDVFMRLTVDFARACTLSLKVP